MASQPTLLEGSIDQALSELQKRVRSEPAVSRHRVSLFELFAISGQWDRAMTQLDVVGEFDAAAMPLAETYRSALRCEALRAEVFVGKRSPLVFGAPEPWVALLIEALRLAGEGKDGPADALKEQAFEEAPAIPGRLIRRTGLEGNATAADEGAEPFEWIGDADSRLGPVLEAIVLGRYYWIPFARVRRIAVEQPRDVRDLVWMPAQFEWSNGGEAVGLIPARYPGSERSEHDAIRLARRTEWIERSPSSYLGLGQKMLATDAGDVAIMDVRRIDLDAASETSSGIAEDADA